MRQIIINQFEKVGSNDINSLQAALSKALQDDFLYNFFQQTNGILPGGFTPSVVSSTKTQYGAGVAFFYDSTAVGVNPNYRALVAASSFQATHTTPDPTHDRYDLICLAPNLAVTSTANRYVKTGGTGPVTLTTVNKIAADQYTLTVVAGTPAASPTIPATPAGNLSLYAVRITAVTGPSGTFLPQFSTLYAPKAPLNKLVSSSCGSFTDSSGSYTAVTNLSISFQSYGRPVWVGLIPDGSGLASMGSFCTLGTVDLKSQFALLCGSTKIAETFVESEAAGGTVAMESHLMPVGGLWTIYDLAAGINTFSVQAKKVTGDNVQVNNAKLVVYEL